MTIAFRDDSGQEQNDTTIYSWAAIYKKYKGEWKIENVVATERPAEE